jgi:multimeric flavodoxin WrbA/nitrite reductase/ring-hydroxylating ferredoxin subunit
MPLKEISMPKNIPKVKHNAWLDLGEVKNFKDKPVSEVNAGDLKLAISYVKGEFGAVSGVCNHIGGPLGQGKLDGDYIVCPWHYYKFHRLNGQGEPGFESDCIPSHALRVKDGHLWVQAKPLTGRHKDAHPAHPLARKVERQAGPPRVVGISTTAMTAGQPRFSTSHFLLEHALTHAQQELKSETRLITLNDLHFRNCEGFYSKHKRACTWPCSITQMDEKDQMEQVYKAMVHWADVVLIATPIRWGAASSLYFKMVERMNCIQNYITTNNRVLIQNKVAAFIITGGQDNVQAVAGQMLGFFSELGFVLPAFPYIAHSLGWTAENMERNVRYVQDNQALQEGARTLVKRAIDTAKTLFNKNPEKNEPTRPLSMGGRKAKGFEKTSPS